jgi:hypothetical protein
MKRCAALLFCFIAPALAACGESGAADVWAGTVDTLPSGRIVVSNPAEGIWDRTGTPWEIREVLRIGTMEGEGPDLFGSIVALEVDAAARLWVFDRQANELRVFGADGVHVRTIGRKGGGPREFNQVIGMAWGPGENLWVVDPSNNRFSIIDTAGNFVKSLPAIGGWIISPWPGGFDAEGRFYTYVPIPDADGETRLHMVQYAVDSTLVPLDTIPTPRYGGEGNFFEIRSDRGFMRATVPFSPGLRWRLSRSGTIWAVLTGEYRMFEITFAGDTLREITKAYAPLPVTGADVDSAITDLDWFTRQGGKIDRSKFPSVKPAVEQLHPGEDGTVWIEPVVETAGASGRVLDVFDERGRYLGRVDLPFPLAAYPRPVFHRDRIYGVTRDELEVPYVIVAEVVKPDRP